MSRFEMPLAWKNLTHEPRRLLVAVAGIGFAVLLIFVETGFENALFDSTVEVLRQLDADIIIASRAKYALTVSRTFPLRRLSQADAVEGVKGAYPLYIEPYYGIWKPPGQSGRSRRSYPIRVLAFHPSDPVFNLPAIKEYANQLRAPDAAIVDVTSKSKYGLPDPDDITTLQGVELSNKAIHLVGTFRLGTDFANDGNLIMSAASFASHFPHRAFGRDPLSEVDLGIVQVDDPSKTDEIVKRLQAALGTEDVRVASKEDFIRREITFWRISTPVGFIFTMGTMMGFVVGVIICYQIIYSEITDRMAELATLKAMGYRNTFFIKLVLQQSFFLSLLGFIPGLLVARILYGQLASVTGLLMDLSPPRAAWVLVLTLAMCTVSGCLAMRKVLAADPAELF